MTAKRAAIDWGSDTVPVLFVPRVIIRCPGCDGDGFDFVRTVQREYGNVERRYYCHHCDCGFKVIAEPCQESADG